MQNRMSIVACLTAITIIPSAMADAASDAKTVTSVGYVTRTRQPILTAKQGDYVVMYPNEDNSDEDGSVGQRAIVTSVGSGNELVTAGGIKSALDAKQAKIPAGTSGNLVTYSGTAGSVGSAAVYNGSNSYDSQTTALVQARHVNMAAQNAFNAHITCANQECTLYNINMVSGTVVPQSGH